MTTIRYTNIRWDLDGQDLDVDLPQEMTLETDPSVLDDENAEEIISDMLTEATGFCHKGFVYEVYEAE